MAYFNNILRGLLAALLLTTTLQAQDATALITKNAVNCDGFPIPNEPLYASLKNYKCICIGEMHGTEEPAALLVYLTRLYAAAGKRVIVGIEIPKTAMAGFIEERDSVHLAKSKFFSGQYGNGRASEAWFNALTTCNRLGVDFCFFDSDSDSAMYLNILEQYRRDTSAVMLTLSNKTHNRFTPKAASPTMGYYLKSFFGKQFCSIDHIFGGGTMYHRTSQGLELYEFPAVNQVFANATHYRSYFIANPFNASNGCSGYFYTERVTASPPYHAEKADNFAAQTP
jgi:hypothetical protein